MKNNTEIKNWYEHKEKTKLGYKLMLFVLKVFPAIFMRFLAFPIGFFYFLYGKGTRTVSAEYLGNLNEFISKNSEETKKLRYNSSLSHIVSFALNLVENIQSWAGKFSFKKNVHWQQDDVLDLVKNINDQKGVLLLVSHLGNAQMLKGLASQNEAGTTQKMSITTITDVDLTAGFNALVNKVNSDSSFHLISSNNIGPDTILQLQDRLEKGEVVVIAGDRISAHTDRFIELDFLGHKANFPYGVFLMISLLNVPTYFVNGLRVKDITIKSEYNMYVRKNPVSFDCGRKEREERIFQTAKNYTKNLEELCIKNPYQWYNFYKFWSE